MLARGLNVAAVAWVERSDDCRDEYTKGRILRLQSNTVMVPTVSASEGRRNDRQLASTSGIRAKCARGAHPIPRVRL